MEFTPQEIEMFAETYERIVRARAKKGMGRKAEQGILLGCAPLGYKNAIVDGEKMIVIDPQTAPKVRELFRLARQKGITVRKLVPLAAEMGLVSRNGKPLGASSHPCDIKQPLLPRAFSLRR